MSFRHMFYHRLKSRNYEHNVLAFCLVTITIIYSFLYYLFGTTITVHTIAQAVSPDHLWTATVEEIINESLMMTDVADEVSLVSVHEPSKVVKILSVEAGGNENDSPHVTWTSNTNLRVNLWSLEYGTVDRRDYSSVHVDIRTDPAADAAIAAFKKSQKAPRGDKTS